MSRADRSGGGSRLPESNFVNVATCEKSEFDDFGVPPEVVERAKVRAEEFEEEYPDRAHLPLTANQEENLLGGYVVEEYREEHVEPESELETGFTVERLDRAEPVTWKDAVFATLVERHQYDENLVGEFEDTATGEEFGVEFTDAWTAEYASEQRAKNAGAQRQLMGGEYPEEHAESARAGEVEPGEWEETAVVLLTHTGSATPEGEHIPPVDHARSVDTWGDVYHRVRNLLEHKWGVPPDRWGYVRSEDPHGIEESGPNAGFTHSHPVVFFDVECADVSARTDAKLVEDITGDFHGDVVTKHVEECELAEPEAHTPERSVEVRLEGDVDEPGAYASAYALPSDGEPMIERSVEYIAWASVLRSMGRQRIARSSLFTDAAKADMCKQSEEHEHADRLEYDRSGHTTELVCAECGSGVGVGDTITVERAGGSRPAATDGGTSTATSTSTKSGRESESAVVGASVGESRERASARERAQNYAESHEVPEGVTPGLLGEMGVSPEHAGVVGEVLAGECSAGVAEPITGECREPDGSRYELKKVRARNGDEKEVSGGGGARRVGLVLPEERLLRETRLQHVEEDRRPKIVVESGGERLATYNPATVARWLVSHGVRIPWIADRLLEFVGAESSVFDSPVPRPGGGRG
jgi:hypothetical protein